MKATHSVHIVGAVLVSAAILTWLGTGREGFTRWPNQRLAGSDAPPPPGQNDLLAEAGFSDGTSPRPDIQSRFALGLAPSGADPAHLISVATAVGVAGVASGTALLVRLRHKGAAR